MESYSAEYPYAPVSKYVRFLIYGGGLGGFGADTTEDLLMRWLEFGIFTPLMRNHSALGTRRQEVYRFENQDAFRHIIELRYGLLPYIYSEYMKAALSDGMYARPLAFAYPEDERAKRVEDQLLIGESIMIAPVYEQNAVGMQRTYPCACLFQKSRRSHIPCGIPPCLKGTPKPAGRERRCIRLPLNQLFA